MPTCMMPSISTSTACCSTLTTQPPACTRHRISSSCCWTCVSPSLCFTPRPCSIRLPCPVSWEGRPGPCQTHQESHWAQSLCLVLLHKYLSCPSLFDTVNQTGRCRINHSQATSCSLPRTKFKASTNLKPPPPLLPAMLSPRPKLLIACQ